MKLHHLEICTKSGKKLLDFFTEKLGFQVSAIRKMPNKTQWVVSNKISPFILTESLTGTKLARDSVFNVALLVNDVHRLTERMQKGGVRVVAEPNETTDKDGSVTQSVVHTGFGNIVHTLIDKSSYKGTFLPGFNPVVSRQYTPPTLSTLTNYIDHVTYACWPGEMDGIIQWYKQWFGMQRHIMNEYDDVKEGLIIGGNIGIRLKAAKTSSGTRVQPFFLVFAEPLTQKVKNHVRTFLEEHGGPGVEHVALTTDNIVETVMEFRRRGLHFREAPKLEGAEDSEFQQVLRKLCILLDTEGHNRYLYQAFTPPIFDEPTFFMEIIQRQGAQAFGAGNILRIMRSIENCDKTQENVILTKEDSTRVNH